jgi:hypothetical protein
MHGRGIRTTMAPQEPMVKRTLFVLAAALAAAAAWALGGNERDALDSSAMAFPGIRPAPYATVLAADGLVTAVFADRDTTSLRVVRVPAAGELPGSAPPAVFVDKVDVALPLSASFGLHACAVVHGGLRMLYLDREKEDRLLLKRVTGEAGGWRLELVEPFGPPLAVLGGPGGKLLDAWAPGTLLLRDEAGDRQLRAPFFPRGQPSMLEAPGSALASGFCCWNDATSELLVVSVDADGVRTFVVPGAGPVAAVAQAPGGVFGVLTWDAASRRILLFERGPADASFRRTTVTVCDGTNALFLASTPAGWLFVYDEEKPAPLGRWLWELCLLAPEPRAVGRPRYRRGVVSSGDSEVTSFKAAIAGGALFVLEVRDGLRLLKTPLP